MFSSMQTDFPHCACLPSNALHEQATPLAAGGCARGFARSSRLNVTSHEACVKECANVQMCKSDVVE